MKAEYDFSKSRRNPYASRVKRQITIRLDEPTIEHFKALAEESGVGPGPDQPLLARLRGKKEEA